MSGPRAKVLEWRCDGCGAPVGNGEGWIVADDGAARKVSRDHADYSHARDGWMPAAELGRLPGPVPWEVWHERCDPAAERADYWIAVERARTLPALLIWWLHMAPKHWFAYTDWERLIRRRVLPQIGGNGDGTL